MLKKSIALRGTAGLGDNSYYNMRLNVYTAI